LPAMIRKKKGVQTHNGHSVENMQEFDVMGGYSQEKKKRSTKRISPSPRKEENVCQQTKKKKTKEIGPIWSRRHAR